jgi:tRNA threonylcarbamoyladenosine biosynthesis protein TsaB
MASRLQYRCPSGGYVAIAAILNLLALDTSSHWCSAALWLGGCARTLEENAGRRHSELILPMIDALLQEAGLSVQQLDGIAFGAGPGSFTGLRIACGIAQGLAFAAGLPVAAVGTLECLAEASGEARVVSALDARMGEVYIAAFERAGDAWRTVSEPALCRPDLAPELAGAWAGCGNGFAVHGEALARRYDGRLAVVRAELFPHAREVAAIGARTLASGGGVEPALAAPIYIRDKVALSLAERAARAAWTSSAEA